MSESGVDLGDAKPKTKLDFLAEKVLSACGLSSQLPKDCFEGQDQPYLYALEKFLDIDHEVNVKVPPVAETNGDTAALLTCTNVSPSFHYQNGSNGEGSKSKLPEYWSPPLSNVEMKGSEMLLPSLEDVAPFNGEFYRCVGQMIVCAFSSASGPYRAQVQKDNDCDDGRPKENYSLYQNIDAVRVTHILSVLMELNVNGGDKNRHIIKRTKFQLNASTSENITDELDDVSFLDLLLLYTEGTTHVSVVDSNSLEDTPRSTQKSVPLMNSIFKNIAALPQLESHVHIMTRLFRGSAPAAKSDGSSTSLKIAHAKKAEIYQERLEQELCRHVDSLERITGMVYEKVDYTLRKKARLRMGSLLHSFVLTNGTSRGSGLGGFHMGLENTGAAGVDSILKIILRILRGLAVRESNVDGDFSLPDSYTHLLHHVLLPLHKPSGMILWRDQQPLLGLYHKTLTQCIGAIVTLDNDLIGKVVKFIIHPDVWPLEGKREGGGTSLANTPKLVLLLHEIDTYIGLLELDPNDTTDQMSDVVVPLVLRLCSCISSDNSRSSERALEFFKNNTFKSLVHRNLTQLMVPLLRSLCRIDSGMEVPWNPTVRKMTLLVLRELESFDKDIFEESCRGIFAAGGVDLQKMPESSSSTGPVRSILIQTHDESPTADMISLRWRPPPNPMAASRSSDPSGNTSSISMPPPPRRPRSGVQPPLTVTGVAPWAIKRSDANRSNLPNSRPIQPRSSKFIAPVLERGHDKERAVPRPKVLPIVKSERLPVSGNCVELKERSEMNGTTRIRSYMEKLKPATSEDDDESDDGISSWAKAQTSESPVLLPDLKFHDLVFGDVLGTGAFSTVKYARQITKAKTRSFWPEFVSAI